MNHLLNDKTLNVIFKILICIAVSKSIALAFFIFLPKSGVEISRGEKNLINFNAYDFSFFSRPSQNSEVLNTQNSQISSLKLSAIYKENSGKNVFIIISDGSSSEVLKTGDRYKQYVVGEVKSNGAFLKENDNDLWIALAEITSQNTQAATSRVSPSRQNLQTNEQEYTNILKRSEIDELMANPDTVFKNIGFKEVMKNGKMEGFRVLSINRNSPLAKLGLRAGDIVQSFNGIKLDNYSSVLEIYNNAKSYSRVKLEVMRNNEKKEFEYEIY
ncbi:MAG: PDZ domain-containing protein [Campylobacteraceae bacterium]|jgi:type II secretion system protein C|nr:PDZ domain-containing protein [Campylobacteraceae bacterium]